MQFRKNRKYKMTLEDHIELGQAIKDFRNSLHRIVKLLGGYDLLLAKDQDRLCALTRWNVVEELRSDAEDLMFRENPKLGHNAISVYYHEDERVTVDDIIKD